MMTNKSAEIGLMIFLGISRKEVRGFFLSNSRSAKRLNPMAAFLAKRMHKITRNKRRTFNVPPFSWIANENPIKAKGSENMVWLTFMKDK